MLMIPSELDEIERKDKIELYIKVMLEVCKSKTSEDSDSDDFTDPSPKGMLLLTQKTSKMSERKL